MVCPAESVEEKVQHEMQRRRLFKALTVVLLAAAWSLAATAEPFRPAADDVVLERLPIALSGDSELRRQRAELSQQPANLDLAVDLAWRYLEASRDDGDPRFRGHARAVLAPWWDQAQPPTAVLLLRATLRQKEHGFAGALQDLESLLRREPRNAQAWLTRSVVLLVQGDADAAAESCLPLHRTRPVVASACTAIAISHGGQAARAQGMLARALSSGLALSKEEQVWALTALADIAVRLGDDAAAEEHFRKALAVGVRDLYLLSAYADFLLASERPREARELLAGETRSDALLLRLALAEQRLGSDVAERHIDQLEARFEENRRRGEGLHRGAESRFRLQLTGDTQEALRLAVENWEEQREPVDALRVLEAAVANNDPTAAQPVLEWIRTSKLEDVRLEALTQLLEKQS